MSIRDHQPVTIEEFNGLWKRGDADSTPADHFSDCNNVKYIQSGFETRDGIDTYLPRPNIIRIYTYIKQGGESLLVLDTDGNIWDTDYNTTPILSIAGMTDFGFFAFDGRAYISPSNGTTGLSGESVYVYLGDGTAARKAAGAKPTGTMTGAQGAAGHVEAGIHIFGVVYETNTGFLTAVGPTTLAQVTSDGTKKVDLSSIPVSPNSYVTKRHIVVTKLIQPQFFTGDQTGYQFFFLPSGVIADNTTTTLTVDFYDVELLEDASHLLDIFETIPAGVGLNSFHNRMIVYGTNTDISTCWVSDVGEPESINQVDGLIIFPLDGKPLTYGQEFRDVLYLFKATRTNGWSDNGDVPATWPMTVLDQGIGCSLHGMATVLDSEGVNVDFLLVGGYTGILMFNGAYQAMELTWKIRDLWLSFDRTKFNKLQILNNSIEKILYITLPDGTMLIGDYSNALDYKDIRWSPWSFALVITCTALINADTLVLSASGLL